MTLVLAAVTIIVFLLCLSQSNNSTISPVILLRYGAVFTGVLESHAYWRFLSYGFLHVDGIHLLSNMLCLFLWGAHLERRVGAFYFLAIYLAAMVAGGVVSALMHMGPYFMVGASGATSGILGALLALAILGRADILASFFVVNIGLNIALALGVARIDWTAHLGGFLGGLIACALVDVLEKVASHALRCKFPEFVKVNGGIVAALAAFQALRAGWIPQAWNGAIQTAVLLVVFLVFVKATDLVLSMKKGLAVVVIACAIANAAMVFMFRDVLTDAMSSSCKAGNAARMTAGQFAPLCSSPDAVIFGFAAIAVAATLLLLWHELNRGFADVGFVGATLTAERRRRTGL